MVLIRIPAISFLTVLAAITLIQGVAGVRGSKACAGHEEELLCLWLLLPNQLLV